MSVCIPVLQKDSLPWPGPPLVTRRPYLYIPHQGPAVDGDGGSSQGSFQGVHENKRLSRDHVLIIRVIVVAAMVVAFYN